jgi:alpha-1,2-mannosyltransferase
VALGTSSALQHGILGFLPLLLCGYLIQHLVGADILALDFRQTYWGAGWNVLHGLDPYTWSPAAVSAARAFVYPAPAALLMAPFALLPVGPAALLFALLDIAAGLGAVWLAGARDWRVFGLVLLLPWFVSGWQTGNLTLLLALGVAATWRFRDQPILAGVLTGLLISLKPFCWPLALWLLATRRLWAAGWSLLSVVGLNAVSWLVLGPAEIHRYLHLSAAVTGALDRTGYGLLSLTTHLGGSRSTGIALTVAVSTAVAIICLVLARRGQEADALTLAVLLMLVASPLLWTHYFALLLVPMVLAWPWLQPIWLLPLLLWPAAVRTDVLWQILLSWSTVAVLVAQMLRTGICPDPGTGR